MRLFCLIAVLLLFTGVAPAQPPGLQQPLIQVTGQGEFWVSPDQIEFRLRLASEHPQAEQAMQANQRQLEGLRELLKAFSLEAGSFQVSDVNLGHPYQNGSRRESFEASRECAFRLNQVEQKDSFLLAFSARNLGEIQSSRACLKNPLPWREKARLQALGEARRKAQAMAESLQQSIGKAYWIEEFNPDFWQNTSSNVVTRLSDADPTSGLGQIRISATVKVAFLLR